MLTLYRGNCLIKGYTKWKLYPELSFFLSEIFHIFVIWVFLLENTKNHKRKGKSSIGNQLCNVKKVCPSYSAAAFFLLTRWPFWTVLLNFALCLNKCICIEIFTHGLGFQTITTYWGPWETYWSAVNFFPWLYTLNNFPKQYSYMPHSF